MYSVVWDEQEAELIIKLSAIRVRTADMEELAVLRGRIAEYNRQIFNRLAGDLAGSHIRESARAEIVIGPVERSYMKHMAAVLEQLPISYRESDGQGMRMQGRKKRCQELTDKLGIFLNSSQYICWMEKGENGRLALCTVPMERILYYGDHAGSSALSRYLDMTAVKRSRAVVVCGGNEGNAAHHYQGNLTSPESPGASREAVEVRVGPGSDGFLLELWGNLPDIVTVSVRSPSGETIPPIRLGVQDIITYGFIYERTRITIAGTLVETASGEELITMRVQAPTAGIWTFVVEAVRDMDVHNGRFNMWLPIRQFLNAEVTFLKPSPYTTLTEPAMASDVISVSTYDGVTRSFYIESGRRFTRTGEINPDFAAPGVNVSVIRGKQTGSSLAAAITAGAVAQFMQWAVVEGNNIFVERREIKNYFVRGATRSCDVNYPNQEWGYGQLNLQGTFDVMIGV